MKIRPKVMGGFLLIASLTIMSGVAGLVGTSSMIRSFEGGESHVRSIIAAAVESSGRAKGAEVNLTLYLLLHDEVYKTTFFQRCESLAQSISILDKRVRVPAARKIVERMKSVTEQVMPAGKRLTEAHDKDMKNVGRFILEKHGVSIRTFHGLTRRLRSDGIELAELETDFLNRQEAITASTQVNSYAMRAEGHLILHLLLHNDVDREKFFKRCASLTENISMLKKRVRDREGKKILKRIETAAAKMVPVGTALLEAHDEEMKPVGQCLPGKCVRLLRTLRKMIGDVRANATALTTNSIEVETQPRIVALKTAANTQHIILAIMIASICVALTLGYLLSRTIANPIMELTQATAEAAKGDFHTRMAVRSKDEVGVLAESFNVMTENLDKTTSELMKANEQLKNEITERKRAEEQVSTSLKEKEILLREIHHRVKNNLAVIISLLGIQCQFADDEVREMFEEVQDRIYAMATAHETLYQSENMATLNARDYVERLVDHLFVSHGNEEDTPSLKKDVQELLLRIDTAIPLGMLLTELISNALKHAFPGNRRGEVRITLRSVGEYEYELGVSDNGVGIPDDVDLEKPASLGLDLVKTFVEQLKGKLSISVANGTSFRVRFCEKA